MLAPDAGISQLCSSPECIGWGQNTMGNFSLRCACGGDCLLLQIGAGAGFVVTVVNCLWEDCGEKGMVCFLLALCNPHGQCMFPNHAFSYSLLQGRHNQSLNSLQRSGLAPWTLQNVWKLLLPSLLQACIRVRM